MSFSLYPPLAALAVLVAGVDQVAGLGDALIVAGGVALAAWLAFVAYHFLREAS